jgi:hypothetical protein
MKNIFLILIYSFIISACSSEEDSSSIAAKVSQSTSTACPVGFVKILGNGILGTNDFCVMKYEAKDNAGVPTSQSSGFPWVSIKAVDAQSKCEALTESGFVGIFSMISNSEWMTIARDIESTNENWSGGIAGAGRLLRGHSDNSPANFLEVTDDSDPYDGTGNSSVDAVGSGWEQGRTHLLSNGSVIWDFAGNVWEWSDWDSSTTGFDLGPIDEITGFKQLNVNPTGSLTRDDYQPDGNFDTSEYVGMWAGGTGGAAFRGGQYSNNTVAGIYAIALYLSSNISVGQIGFRCVYRP